MPHRLLLQLALPPRAPLWQALVAGLGVFVACVALRALLDYVIPGRLPFITFFPGMAVATIWGPTAGAIVLAGAVTGWLLRALDARSIDGATLVVGGIVLDCSVH